MTLADTLAEKAGLRVGKPQRLGSKQAGTITVTRGDKKVEYLYSYDQLIAVCATEGGAFVHKAITAFKYSVTTTGHKKETYHLWNYGIPEIPHGEFCMVVLLANTFIGLEYAPKADFSNLAKRGSINGQYSANHYPDIAAK